MLLTKQLTKPKYSIELIQYLTKNHQCFWLTTHCRGGENTTIQYLSQFYSKKELEYFKYILPTDWVDKKTEAIDFNSNFIWLEDYPFESEKLDLVKNKALKSLFVIDLKQKDELKITLNRIKEHIK